jgi:hypothetical protein
MHPLAPELEAACLRALAAAWHAVNQERFGGALAPPALELACTTTRLGRWEPVTRTLSLSRRLVVDGGWGHVLEVLKHEMAHQYVWEVLGEREETPHGPSFVALCDRLGIDASPAGPLPGDAGRPVIERVTKLLALAGSPNEHEARAAMAAAQRLMLKHNVTVAAQGGARRYGFRHLGSPSGRISEAERILAGILGRHFFVECLWVPVWRVREGKRGMVLEVCGRAENLELAAHVHAFLLGTAERLWREWPGRGAPRREKRAFQAGVMSGFRETLERQEEQHRREALVWVGDADLRRYQRRRYPHVRSTSYRKSPGDSARAAGREAGKKVVLHRPVAGGPSVGGPRLLAR